MAEASLAVDEAPVGRWRYRHLRQVAFWIALLVIWSVGGLSYYSTRMLLDDTREADRAQTVHVTAEHLLNLLEEAGSAQLSHALEGTGRLELYRKARAEVPGVLVRLAAMVEGHPDQQRRVEVLRDLTAERLELLAASMASPVLGGLAPSDRQRLMSLNSTMMQIRRSVAALADHETGRYIEMRARVEARMRSATAALLVGITLGTGAILALFWLMNREVRRRRRAEGELLGANTDLVRLNAELDDRVHERTRRLEAEVVEREALAERLRQSSETVRVILDASPFAIFGLDPDYNVLAWNRGAERLFGYTADEVVGRPYPLVPPEGRAEFEALFARLARGEMLRDMNVRRRRKDGTILDVRYSGAPVFHADGTLRGGVYALEDISASKQVRRQLEHAQRMEAIGQLTGGMAHDFNNLLTVIIGNLDLLDEMLAGQPDAREMATVALDAGLRGAELTRQLLGFSRRQSLEPKVLDLNEVAASTTKLLRRTLGEDVEIRMCLADDLWPSIADPAQVESALTNLAINARDAMPAGGRLTIETANKQLDEAYAAANSEIEPGDYVMLAVSDTGGGIASDIVDRVMEPFFTTKAEGKGSGLGLSMIYGFAKQSRGHLKIYSELGHGTVVRLYLPRAQADAAESVPLPAAATEQPAEDATILVVEDKEEVRNVAVAQLKGFGYRVLEAASADDAMAILEGDPSIDLLFTDIVMPGTMTGADLARAARSKRPELKVLLTSGFAEASLQGEARAEEQQPILSKPYRKQDLAAKVRELLAVADQ